MKIVKVTIEVEVPDDFNDYEALAMFVNGGIDNFPEPEEIDEELKDISFLSAYAYED